MRNNSKIIPWILYDFASSAFAAIVQTFIFANLFIEKIALTPTWGATQWGFVNGLSGIIIALICPVLGAIADRAKKRKIWLVTFTFLAIASSFFLPFANTPFWSLGIFGLGVIGAESAFVFYNAYLPDIAPKKEIGKISGIGWSMGFLGGLLSLIVALTFFNQQPEASLFLASFWYFFFSLPFIFSLKEEKAAMGAKKAIVEGVKQLTKTIKEMKKHLNLALFLLAHLIYIDALHTLFAFGGIFATSEFHVDYQGIIFFGILLHVTAGLGAFFFSFIDDRIGSKNLILISLLGLIITTFLILIVNQITLFWVFAALFGIFVGPVQSASRSFLAKNIPKQMQTEFFGLFAFSGKATLFIGPLIVSGITYLSESLRVGLIFILFLFILGSFLMLKVKDNSKVC